MPETHGALPSEWLERLDAPGRLTRALDLVYGPDPIIRRARLALIRQCLETYREHFGDHPVRMARAPARINLRGMHVDTHGGYLNLMSHQREAVVVAGRSRDVGLCRWRSLQHPEPLHFQATHWDDLLQRYTWSQFLERPEVMAHVHDKPGAWGHYLAGALFRLRQMALKRQLPVMPMQGVVGGDIPQGAALSSSAALCVAATYALGALQGMALTPDETILCARDAEWYSGARTGLSDQSAVLLAQPDSFLHGAPDPNDFRAADLQPQPFPAALQVLVIDSQTRRSLSGAQRLAYTRNRFAYALALEALRQAGAAAGYPEAVWKRWDRLARLTPEAFGGIGACYALLRAIPENAAYGALAQRFPALDIPGLAKRYFGETPPAKGAAIPLRGPLLFGLAESARARALPDLLQRGDFKTTGHYLTLGHAGDRVRQADGQPYEAPCDDAYLQRCLRDAIPLENCPGVYGASTPALDGLVDQAMTAGALGACLTGAGLAGAVIALCRREKADHIAAQLRDWMAGDTYAALADLEGPLDAETVQTAVQRNHSIAGASLLPC